MTKPSTPTYQTRHSPAEPVTAPARFELHVDATAVDRLPARFGRQLKAAGGTYSQCRGGRTTRYVEVPNTREGRAVADAILRAHCLGDASTVITRGVGRNLPAWVTVHKARSTGEALLRLGTMLARAARRGIIDRVD